MKLIELLERIRSTKARSAWERGVKLYAEMIISRISEDYNDDEDIDTSERRLLNGARNWYAYSYGGCAYIYHGDIVRALCTVSERRRKQYGLYQPNRQETWLDVQARALCQAAKLILKIANQEAQ